MAAVIRDIADMWAESPARLVASVALTVLATAAGWAVLALLLLAGSPS